MRMRTGTMESFFYSQKSPDILVCFYKNPKLHLNIIPFILLYEAELDKVQLKKITVM